MRTPLCGLEFASKVPNAPVQVGAPVVVVLDCADDTADFRFHGARGVVSGLVFDDPAQQFPRKPLVEVTVEGLGTEWFFLRELHVLG